MATCTDASRHPERSTWRSVLVLIAITLISKDSTAQQGPSNSSQRPNIVLISLDDADRDMFREEILEQRFPTINNLARRGLAFTNFHVTNPLCGPSRACLLRGQYAHAINHRTNKEGGVNTRGFLGDSRSFVRQGYYDNDLGTWMKEAGYHTIFVGKYINNMGAEKRLAAGWHDFYLSQGSRYFETYRFTNRTNPWGKAEQLPPDVYRTNAEADDVVRLIHERGNEQKPMFVYFAPFGPHTEGNSEGGMIDHADQNTWHGIQQPQQCDFDEVDLSDKPEPYQRLARIDERIQRKISVEYRDRMLAVRSVDKAIGRIVEALKEKGLFENTFLIVTSDNGYSLGQHRICGKGNSFSRSSQVPLIVVGPGIKAGGRANHLLAHIDLAPTLLDLANTPAKSFHDGKSFKPLLTNPESCPASQWRHSFLIENWQYRTYLGMRLDTTFCQLRMYDSVYTEWANGSREYYDLGTDPLELENRYASLPNDVKHELSNRLKSVRRPQAAPILTVESVGQTEQQGVSRFVVRGVAEDSSGIDNVHLVAYRVSTSEFWNGLSWQKTRCRFDADLKNRHGIQTEWECSLTTRDDLTNGIYVLPLSAATNGNRSTWTKPIRLIPDQRPPVTRIFDVRQVGSNQARIKGMAIDDGEVTEVKLHFQCLDSGLYFDGNRWSQKCQCIRCQPKKDGRWEIKVPRPAAGRYVIRARAFDQAGNFAEQCEEKEFRVTESPTKPGAVFER